MDRSKIIAACSLVLFAAAMRHLPHLPNLTPIAAIGFIGSWYIGKRWGLFLPLAAVIVSDMTIGLYDWRIMLAVYASFALAGVTAWASRQSILWAGLSVIAASIIFFLATNAAVWMFSPWYEKSIAGLLYAYELGLPFFRNMMAGDILYVAGMAGAAEVVRALGRRMAGTSSAAEKKVDIPGIVT